MPVRRLNYTGRQRIKKEHVRIILEEENGHLTFDAHLDLDTYDLPDSAEVFVEAYRQYTLMRFPFGEAAHPEPPERCELSEFTSPDAIRFRVIVSQDTEPSGRLLALAEGISGHGEQSDEDRIPLLPVRADEDLEHEIFRVEFDDEPILLVNAAADDWRELTREPAFAALAYPSILRHVLTRVIIVDEHYDDSDMQDWRAKWIRFGRLMPGAGSIPSGDEPEHERIDWIDRAVSGFCRSQKLMDQFGRYWTGEGRG